MHSLTRSVNVGRIAPAHSRLAKLHDEIETLIQIPFPVLLERANEVWISEFRNCCERSNWDSLTMQQLPLQAHLDQSKSSFLWIFTWEWIALSAK